MLSFTLVAVFAITFLIFWNFMRVSGKEKGKYKTIPGPIGIPVFGHIFFLGTKMYETFAKWSKKYGKIYQIRFGSRKVVVLSDPKWIKEAFNYEEFSGREAFEGFQMYDNEPLGIASIQGEFWKATRRFVLMNLRDFGFGKSSMEGLVTEEVKKTIEHMNKFPNKRVDSIKDVMQIAVLNSLWLIVGSRRFEHDDQKILDMMNDGHELLRQVMKQVIVVFIPWTKPFFPKFTTFDKMKVKGREFYVNIVDEHKKDLKDDAPKDFIDAFLLEMKANANNPSSIFYGAKAERHLTAVLADLFFAGSDTTSVTLSWIFLYLTMFEDKQNKLQEEIKAVTDDIRHVTLSDRQKMPYALAIIEETLRFSSINSTGFQHCATTGREFQGYFIEKGSWIFPNLYAMHHDKEVWGDPETFRPERFLSDDGKTCQKSDYMLPFQIGRRQCIGEPLARDTIFLFVTNIFQRFHISLDPNGPEPTLEPEVSFLLTPKPYSILLKDRTKDLID